MPQDVEFFLPFPDRISPDVTAAAERNLDWVRAHGLVEDEESVTRYRSWRLAELAGRFFPDAVDDDLDVGADAMGFFFLFDDHFDDPLAADPRLVAQVCDNLIDLTGPTACGRVRPRSGLAAAWADVWRRSVEGMSASWRVRAAHHWRVYFASYVTEAMNRRDRVVLDVPAYLELRRRSIATDPVLDLAERTGRSEVTTDRFDSRYLRTVRRITSDVVIMVNDVCSVEKEEARNDPHNLILVMQRLDGCGRDRTVTRIVDMVEHEVRDFVRLSAVLPDLLREDGATDQEITAVNHYVRAACACMRGNYDWGRRSDRYSFAAAPAAVP